MSRELLKRFQNAAGRQHLLDALAKQKIVEGNRSLAKALAARCKLLALNESQTLITQGDSDADAYFILLGSLEILIHGRRVNIRRANEHVGEMALIDPQAKRSATVVALENSVVAKITESHFTSLAKTYPRLWRLIAVELGDRLRQRNDTVRPKNARPMLFIGSSKESLRVAKALKRSLKGNPFDVVLWTKGIFGASNFPLESLEEQLKRTDIAVLVMGPDDKVTSRGKQRSAPRDNIVFELGLFMGGLAHKRTFMVHPRGLNIKIPSDLLGLTPMTYRSDSGALSKALKPVCDELRTRVSELWTI